MDLIDLQAARIVGIPGWEVYKWERVDPDGWMLTGAVGRKITRGKNKGKTTWRDCDPSTERRIVITRAEHDAFCVEWERETGLCSACRGKGKVWRGWTRAEGTLWAPCKVCGETGKARETP